MLKKQDVIYLSLLEARPKGIPTPELVRIIGGNPKTVAGRTYRLVAAGLITNEKLAGVPSNTIKLTEHGRKELQAAGVSTRAASEEYEPEMAGINIDSIANDLADNLSRIIGVNAEYRNALLKLRNSLLSQAEEIDQILNKFIVDKT